MTGPSVTPKRYACAGCEQLVEVRGQFCSVKCAVDNGSIDPPEDPHEDDRREFYP